MRAAAMPTAAEGQEVLEPAFVATMQAPTAFQPSAQVVGSRSPFPRAAWPCRRQGPRLERMVGNATHGGVQGPACRAG